MATNGLDTNNGLSWTGAVATVGKALTLATSPSDVILVTNGTYGITATLLVTNAITLQSVEGAGATIIQRSGAGNIRIMVVSNSAAIVDGFTIRNGYAPSADFSAPPWASGTANGAGGIWMHNGTVRNCIIRDNSAVGTHMAVAGGVGMSGGLLQNCTVISNRVDSTNGREQGAGVRMTGGIVENCTITHNECQRNEWNSDDGGAGLWLNAGTARNCLIAGNRIAYAGGSGWGAGVRIQGGTLVHCTVTRNLSESQYGGLYRGGGAVSNCVIYANLARINPQDVNNSASITYSCSPDLTSGTGNTTSDPRFVDPGTGYGRSLVGGNFRLRVGSPCIDAGFNGLTTDMDGTVRPIDGDGNGSSMVDMGAYEASSSTSGTLRCSIAANPSSGTSPLVVQLTGSVAGTNTGFIEYFWDFTNDGSDDTNGPTLQVVTNTYSSLGYVTVRLTITNGAGETATAVLTNTLAILPSTAYVATNGSHAFPYETWAKAATNIQAAIDTVAGSSQLVLVSNGTYNVGMKIGLAKAVTVRSVEGASNTIIQASGSLRVAHLSHSGAVLDGFTLRGGAATHRDVYDANGGMVAGGAGVYITDGTVRNCIVSNNTVTTDHMAVGGGVCLAGGRLLDSTVTRNTISSSAGREQGGGVQMRGTSLVERCIISYNATINNGYALNDGGGGVWMGDTCVLRNCLVIGNYTKYTGNAQRGGGVRMQGGTMLHCTVARNQAGADYGGVYRVAGAVSNCVIYFNTAGTPPNDCGAIASYYSCASDLSGGAGNTTADPQFQDSGSGYGTNLLGGDFRIRLTSPCVDTAATMASVTNDLAGSLRPTDGDGDLLNEWDMGCYEAPDASSVPLTCDFSGTPTVWSSPANVIFTASVAGNTNGVGYAWDFTNDGSDDAVGTDKKVVTNTYVGIGYYTIKLTVTNLVGDTESVVHSNYVRVAPSTAYVATNGGNVFPYETWNNAARSLQDAIDSTAGSNQLVLVSNGTYAVTVPVTLGKAVEVRSVGGAQNATIRGVGGKRVFYISDPGAVLDGFTIRDGSSTIQDLWNASMGYIAGGAGVWMLDGTVRNCTIRNNLAAVAHAAAGGGVYMDGGRLFNCTVTSNGINSANGREPGGGVFAQGYSRVENCVITYNYTAWASAANSWDGGAGLWIGGSVTSRNCLIAGNRTDCNAAQHRGGGVRIQSGLLESSTIVRNFSATTEGGVYLAGGAMVNCVVSDNVSASAPTNVGPIATVTYSAASDLTSGTGNLTGAPTFRIPGSGAGTNAVLGDYRLLAGSVGENVGTNLAWMDGAFDLRGDPRIARRRVDMGAYEIQPPPGSIFVVR